MDCSVPFKRLSLEVKLKKLIENNASEFKIKRIQKKIDKLATLQQIEMIQYKITNREDQQEKIS